MFGRGFSRGQHRRKNWNKECSAVICERDSSRMGIAFYQVPQKLATFRVLDSSLTSTLHWCETSVALCRHGNGHFRNVDAKQKNVGRVANSAVKTVLSCKGS